MDRMSDSGSDDLGSNPGGVTQAGILSILIESPFFVYCQNPCQLWDWGEK